MVTAKGAMASKCHKIQVLLGMNFDLCDNYVRF